MNWILFHPVNPVFLVFLNFMGDHSVFVRLPPNWAEQ